MIDHPAEPAGEQNRRRWRQAFSAGGWWLHATYLGQRFVRHQHTCCEIGIDERGGHAVRRDGSWHAVQPGSVVVMGSREVHECRQLGPGPWTYRALLLPPQLVSRLIGKRGPNAGLASGHYIDPSLASRFAAAHRLLELDPDAGESELAELLRALHGKQQEQPRRPRSAHRLTAGIERAREWIEAHLERPTSLAELAEIARMSRFHFLRAFRKATGLTPRRYLFQRRVEAAGTLICRGMTPVDAAYQMTFADQSHLTARFREIVGVTPAEFARGAASSASGLTGCSG